VESRIVAKLEVSERSEGNMKFFEDGGGVL